MTHPIKETVSHQNSGLLAAGLKHATLSTSLKFGRKSVTDQKCKASESWRDYQTVSGGG